MTLYKLNMVVGMTIIIYSTRTPN